MSGATVSVAVFAHDEEASIRSCLEALAQIAGEATLSVHVLINGCSDGTEAVVRAYETKAYALNPVVLPRGDKAETWNHYVHVLAPADATLHVFTDGDVTVAPGSVTGMLAHLRDEPAALGCATLPLTGRSRQAFREKLLSRREMAGNLYGLRGSVVAALRSRGIRLPAGFIGEDGLVTTLLRYDLDTRGHRDDRRIVATEEGGFRYPALSPWSPRDMRIYLRRRIRYALRRRQDAMLYPLLFERGVEAMPREIEDLYRTRGEDPGPAVSGLERLFDRLAARRIGRAVAVRQARPSQSAA
ncbi:glycosyltransferase [Roseomonas sp. CCTCC AB2023176]|uniref:glycosyltransferase n=1 Tax=Roseomonas sp. CCTCC AB2023176 TaxID=3342640 RepID=UPI0035D74FBF